MTYLWIVIAVIIFAVIGFRYFVLSAWYLAKAVTDSIKCVILNAFKAINLFDKLKKKK